MANANIKKRLACLLSNFDRLRRQAIQHTEMATSIEGSVAAWKVTFQLDGEDSVRAAIHIPLAGPPTHYEAEQKALQILQTFLDDACEAAKKYKLAN